MQRDPKAGIDLTADPDQEYPSPGAKVAPVTERTLPEQVDLDLAQAESPSPAAELAVRHDLPQEASTLAVVVSPWRVHLDYRVHGPMSWAAQLISLVLLYAVGATVIVPLVVLPAAAGDSLRIAVAAASGAAVLAAGAGLLRYLLRTSSSRVDPKPER